MSPLAALWLYRAAVLLHLASVVVWMGAVAYNLFILRPALKASGIDRQAYYAVHRAIKARIRVVVGVAVAGLVFSGLVLAWRRGLLGGTAATSAFHHALFGIKVAVALLLVPTFLFTFRLLERVKVPQRRGRLFVAVHWAVLALGVVAASAGVLLAR